MEKASIINTLVDWQHWYIQTKRSLIHRPNSLYWPNQQLALLGVRRGGKTFSAIQLCTDLDHVLYMNFEDPIFLDANVKCLDQLVDYFSEYYGAYPKAIIYDEIQNIEGWERWVRKFSDFKKCRLIITGSSSKLLSHELSTAVAGRVIEKTIWPLSFTEFLDFQKLNPHSNEEHIIALKKYLQDGGFPQIALTQNEVEMKTPLEVDSQIKYRVRLLISYEGTNYCGWQSQLVHITKNSIQNILETALTKIFKEKITCTAAGRTDSGAHATSQNVHFEVSRDPRSIPILLALRTELPFSICARKAWLAPKNFSALSSARAKTYRYYVLNSETRSALNWRTTYWHPHPLNLATLQAYAEQIIGRHDFKSFQSANGRPPKSSIRTIYKAQWFSPKENLFVFEITGNGFLTQMVRNLVGCQLDLHRKNKPPEELLHLLKAYDRKAIGKPAPASGLFLTKVHYPKAKLAQLEPLPIVRHNRNQL